MMSSYYRSVSYIIRIQILYLQFRISEIHDTNYLFILIDVIRLHLSSFSSRNYIWRYTRERSMLHDRIAPRRYMCEANTLSDIVHIKFMFRAILKIFTWRYLSCLIHYVVSSSNCNLEWLTRKLIFIQIICESFMYHLNCTGNLDAFFSSRWKICSNDLNEDDQIQWLLLILFHCTTTYCELVMLHDVRRSYRKKLITLLLRSSTYTSPTRSWSKFNNWVQTNSREDDREFHVSYDMYGSRFHILDRVSSYWEECVRPVLISSHSEYF